MFGAALFHHSFQYKRVSDESFFHDFGYLPVFQIWGWLSSQASEADMIGWVPSLVIKHDTGIQINVRIAFLAVFVV